MERDERRGAVATVGSTSSGRGKIRNFATPSQQKPKSIWQSLLHFLIEKVSTVFRLH